MLRLKFFEIAEITFKIGLRLKSGHFDYPAVRLSVGLSKLMMSQHLLTAGRKDFHA